jgi:hypothetical protein
MTKRKLGAEKAKLYIDELKKVADTSFLNEQVDYDFAIDQLGMTTMPENINGEDGLPARIPYEITHIKAEKGRFDYELSLRRLVDPKNLEYSPESFLDWFEVATVRNGLRIFHSNGLMKKLRSNKELVSLIQSVDEPSALFRVEFQDDINFVNSYGFDNSRKPYYVVTLPVLAIPGKTDDALVANFARENAFYEKGWRTAQEPTAKNLASRFKVRISAQEYHTAICEN